MERRFRIWPYLFYFLVTLAMLLASSCGVDEEALEFNRLHVAAAYPPFSCEGLNPDYMLLTASGEVYRLNVYEVNGGLRSEEFELLSGSYEVTSIEVFNSAGTLTHKVSQFNPNDDLIAMWVPFTQNVVNSDDWISALLICN